MSRLKIFAKGNLDVRDSLHSLWLGGKLQWNGINQLLRDRGSGVQAYVRHEPWSRSDALLERTAVIPDELRCRNLALGAHTAKVQFSQALFGSDADVVILSVQPDLQIVPMRHSRDGYLFYPHNWREWCPDDQAWLRTNFITEGILDVDQSMANFLHIVGLIRAHRDVPILIYNVSSVVPGDTVHAYDGMEETLATRIRRFNLGLIELSQVTGISIVDVDMIVARQGANALKLDTTHLTAAGCRAVADEVVRILVDLGCLP